MNAGSSKKYGGKAEPGDVVGVRVDMTRKTLRFYLNNQDLGIAFEGFSTRGGVYPVVCFGVGSSGEFLLPQHRFRLDPKCWGGYHYPLEGDNPRMQLVRPTLASHKARLVFRQLEDNRAAVIAEGSYDWCSAIGRRLGVAAGAGATISLAATSEAEILSNSSSLPQLPTFPSRHAINGLSAHVAASELVTLSRALLKGVSEATMDSDSTDAWQEWMR
eukprot:594031-Amorphochlora_amoeboformis.AAC.1